MCQLCVQGSDFARGTQDSGASAPVFMNFGGRGVKTEDAEVFRDNKGVFLPGNNNDTNMYDLEDVDSQDVDSTSEIEEHHQDSVAYLQDKMDRVLKNSRTPEQRDILWQKLCQEGINDVKSFLMVDVNTIKQKLNHSPNFSLGDIADVVTLRKECQKENPSASASQGDRRDQRRGRRRSPVFHRRGNRRSRSRGGSRRYNGPSRGPRSRFNKGGRGRNGRDNGSRGRGKPQPPALWAAAAEGSLEDVRKLLSEGAAVDQQHQGWTPLMKAAEEGHIQIAVELLDRGADIEASNRKGRTALSFAAAPSMDGKERRPSKVDMVKFLVDKGAKIDRKDDNGQTAKQRASQEGRDEVVSVLEDFEKISAGGAMSDLEG